MSVFALALVAASLLNGYSLVGTIAGGTCAGPFQPVGVIRDGNGKLVHLRCGDRLVLSGAARATVEGISSGVVVFRTDTGKLLRLTAGAFPDDSPSEPEAPGDLLAHRTLPPLGVAGTTTTTE